jgi:hypothetical protein
MPSHELHLEFADARLIRQLIESKNPAKSHIPEPRMTRKRPNESPSYAAPVSKSRRCHCGLCVTCQENARWERIFREKFADPSYYSGVTLRHSSPLNS